MTPLEYHGNSPSWHLLQCCLHMLIRAEGSSPGASSLAWKGNIKLLLPVLVLRAFFSIQALYKIAKRMVIAKQSLPNNCQSFHRSVLIRIFIKKENHSNKFHRPFLKLCFLPVRNILYFSPALVQHCNYKGNALFSLKLYSSLANTYSRLMNYVIFAADVLSQIFFCFVREEKRWMKPWISCVIPWDRGNLTLMRTNQLWIK